MSVPDRALPGGTDIDVKAHLELCFKNVTGEFSIALASTAADGAGFRQHYVDGVAAAVDLIGDQTGQSRNVFFVAGSVWPEGHKGRKTEDIECVCGFGVDFDWAGPGHKDSVLPDRSQVIAGIDQLPNDMQPTWVVETGGGLHALWRFETPVTTDVAADLVKRFGKWAKANLQGFDVCDLTRLLRPVGTIRRKPDCEPFEVAAMVADGPEHSVDYLDTWLPPRTPPATRKELSGSDLPISRYNRERFDVEIDHLRARGWSDSGRDRLLRPGDPASVSSATILNRSEYDYPILYVHSTAALNGPGKYTAADLLAHRTGIEPNNATALARGCSDELETTSLSSTAAATVTSTHLQADVTLSDPWAVDGGDEQFLRLVMSPEAFAAELAKGPPPAPEIGPVDGADGLFMIGRFNLIYGPSGHGKTWVTLFCAAQEMRAGRPVMFFDGENEAREIGHRLTWLGVPADTVVKLIRWVDATDIEALKATVPLSRLFHAEGGRLIVVDGWAALESQWFAGQSTDSNRLAVEYANNLKHMAAAGPAVVAIDHVTLANSTGNKAADDPSGAHQKKAQVTGAAYDVRAIRPLAQGNIGVLQITCTKDRTGFRQPKQALHLEIDATDATNFAVSQTDTDEPSNADGQSPSDELGPSDLDVIRALAGAKGKGYVYAALAQVGKFPVSTLKSRGTLPKLERLGFVWREQLGPGVPKNKPQPWVLIRYENYQIVEWAELDTVTDTVQPKQ